MPEFVIEKRNIPVLTVSSRDGPAASENGDNPLGFRITGGADFEMPITVFQVSEGSPAQKAGLQLGDQILKINGADASAMRLATAQSVIKQAGEQLQMIVAKGDLWSHLPGSIFLYPLPVPCDSRRSSFDSTASSSSLSGHDHRSLSCESCDSLSVLAVEQQLRQMQQQLNEISVIPMQIQATLSFLTQTLSKFAPPEVQRQLPEALRATTAQATEEMDGFVNGTESSGERDAAQDNSEDDEAQDEEAYAITLESLFDESEVLETIPARADEVEDDETTTEEPEISEEERSRIEKLERVIKLQKSWPWSQQEKPIHKRSNCHLVPSVALERSKIKQLTNMDSLPFYKHGYLTRV
ncbi:AGAP003937-PD [Anopheles gambiae str. PEST]|uniref:AGAP003937-PD n=1 Tax=Anopheles gambiae TaxID=7165 RepID=F5HM25_ANOGA|nr:AGAP003937-PD [Anopheles gambiae str. PEST]